MTDIEAAKRKAVAAKAELPKFDMPKAEVPEAFRQIAEKGVQQAKETYSRMKTAAEEATDLMEDTYATATKGATEFSLKAIEALRANMNLSFDYASDVAGAKTLSEAVELAASHMRKQYDAFAAQTQELSALAQKIASATTEPLKAGVSKTFKFN
jgi:phasin